MTGYLFLQKNGVIRIRTVNNSNLPINIKNAHHHLAGLGRAEKLFDGPKSPNAGPTFPKLEAAKPTEDSKSKLNIENTKDPIINESM